MVEQERRGAGEDIGEIYNSNDRGDIEVDDVEDFNLDSE